MPLPEDVQRIQAKHKKNLLKKKNVTGLGFGYKYKGGVRTEETCLVVLVKRKEPLEKLAVADQIPARIEGITADVKEIGEIVIHKNRTDKWRPAPGGVSIGHYLITAGTLAVVVKDATTGEKLILSNNHVLANSNNATKGDPILQPGSADGGQNPQDQIATLERFIRIVYMNGDGNGGGGGGGCAIANLVASILNFSAKILGSSHRVYTKRIEQTVNLVDAAVAKPLSEDLVSDDIIDIGKIEGTKEPELGLEVTKSGRTTGTTTGKIEVIDTTVQVGYGGNNVAEFEHQILTSNMSQPGDSGSLLVDANDKKAVGLLFAGSDTVTVHCPINTVFDLLNITI